MSTQGQSQRSLRLSWGHSQHPLDRAPHDDTSPHFGGARQKVRTFCFIKMTHETLWFRWPQRELHRKDLLCSWVVWGFLLLRIHYYKREGLREPIKERRPKKTKRGSRSHSVLHFLIYAWTGICPLPLALPSPRVCALPQQPLDGSSSYVCLHP